MLLEQVIAFLTDPVGLERTLRFVHALLIITVNSPLLLGFVATSVVQPVLVPPPAPPPSSSKGAGPAADVAGAVAAVAVAEPILRGVLSRISLTRVFFRTFRFLDSFYDAHRLVLGLVGSGVGGRSGAGHDANSSKAPTLRKRLATRGVPALDAASRFCNGVYLASDLLLLADALDVPGLEVWAPDTRRRLRRVSQQHWFFALAASVAAGVLRLAVEPVVVPAPAPAPAPASSAGADAANVDDDASGPDETADSPYVRREQQRLRRQVRRRKRQQAAWLRAARTRLLVVGRRLAADACDLFLPGATLGWLPVRQPRTVGVLMLVSTALTAWEAWDRCGRTVAAAAAAAAADAAKPAKAMKQEEAPAAAAAAPSEKATA